MQLSSTNLAAIARAIAVAASLLRVAAVSLFENDDGSFTAIVDGMEHRDSFEEVVVSAAQAARAVADRELEANSAPPAGMKP